MNELGVGDSLNANNKQLFIFAFNIQKILLTQATYDLQQFASLYLWINL